MCLILFSYDPGQHNRLVVLANRDEFYERETAQADFWEEDGHILGGRDLVAGGTWMGVHTSGRFAAVTNYREPGRFSANALSRGDLTSQFLKSELNSLSYLEKVQKDDELYNGYNLIVYDGKSVGYHSNRSASNPVLLEGGVYGLSNHLLDSEWPKVLKGKELLTTYLQEHPLPDSSILDIMGDDAIAPDDQLPDTGVGLDKERLLSSICVTMPGYGTRCSSMVLLDQSGVREFAERTIVPDDVVPDTISFQFISS